MKTSVVDMMALPLRDSQYLTAVALAKVTSSVVILTVLYALVLSPLKHIPGPFLAKFTNLWRFFSVLSRTPEKQQLQMHDRWGSAVRLGPNMVSISDPAMISEVYSRKKLLKKVSGCGTSK